MYPVKTFSRWMLVGVLASAGALAVAPPASAVANEIALYVPTEGVSHGSDIAVLVDGVPSPVATVHVNGANKGSVPLTSTTESGIYLIRYNRAWGMGTMRVVVDSVTSNAEPLRAFTKVSNWELRRVGPGAKKLKVTVRARTYSPTKNRMVAAKNVTLQAKSGKKWIRVRAMKLKKSGKGTVVFKANKARKYRVVVKQTKTSAGAVHVARGRI